jgi:hypothetical protein
MSSRQPPTIEERMDDSAIQRLEKIRANPNLSVAKIMLGLVIATMTGYAFLGRTQNLGAASRHGYQAYVPYQQDTQTPLSRSPS